MNNLFQSLNGQTPQNQQMNPMQMLQVLRKNPASFLAQAGYTIPDGMNNPQQIIQHLLGSGQINSARLNQAQQMARRFVR